MSSVRAPAPKTAPSAPKTAPSAAPSATPASKPAGGPATPSDGYETSTRTLERSGGDAPLPAGDPALRDQLASARTSANLRTGAPSGARKSGGDGGDVEVEIGSITVRGPNETAAENNYKKNGNKSYDLNSSQGTRELIAQSPQIDGSDKTTNDNTRCGAAAVTNGLLLDGNHRKNAEAIVKTASQLKVEMTPEQRSAVTAMANGKMSPNQAAQVQELLYNCGQKLPGGGNADGLTGKGMVELTQRLRNNGGYANTNYVNYRLEKNPNGAGNHWTMTHVNNKLERTHTNSAPNAQGYAKVEREGGQTLPYGANGKVPENYVTGIDMSFGDKGTHVRVDDPATRSKSLPLPGGGSTTVEEHDPNRYSTFHYDLPKGSNTWDSQRPNPGYGTRSTKTDPFTPQEFATL